VFLLFYVRFVHDLVHVRFVSVRFVCFHVDSVRFVHVSFVRIIHVHVVLDRVRYSIIRGRQILGRVHQLTIIG